MEPLPFPPDPNQDESDNELRELAALAGLLNPESIWLLEEKLDGLNAAPATTPSPTGYTEGAAAETPPDRD